MAQRQDKLARDRARTLLTQRACTIVIAHSTRAALAFARDVLALNVESPSVHVVCATDERDIARVRGYDVATTRVYVVDHGCADRVATQRLVNYLTLMQHTITYASSVPLLERLVE